MSRKKDSAAILTFGIFLVGANLRLPITMLPPLLSDLKRSVGLAPSLAGLLTTIPLVMFALISPLIAKAGNKYGSERTLLAALILLTIGSYLRIIPTIWALMIGTCLVGAGIAGGNVLLPAIIKERFPTQIAIKTSLYTDCIYGISGLNRDWFFWTPGHQNQPPDNNGYFFLGRGCRIDRVGFMSLGDETGAN